jgi:hypothetical protein
MISSFAIENRITPSAKNPIATTKSHTVDKPRPSYFIRLNRLGDSPARIGNVNGINRIDSNPAGRLGFISIAYKSR